MNEEAGYYVEIIEASGNNWVFEFYKDRTSKYTFKQIKDESNRFLLSVNGKWVDGFNFLAEIPHNLDYIQKIIDEKKFFKL